MGVIGIHQQRQALELEKIGTDFFGNGQHFQSAYSDFCFDVPQDNVYGADGALVFTNTLPGITPVCKLDTANSPNAWFNVMFSFTYPGTGPDGNFGGFGQFMSGLSIFALSIYFITSSDSGSLVVDTLASNGAEKHHWLQRAFWAFTEGAVATGLLVVGGNDALGALQTASIVFGLPFNFLIFFMCWSIQRLCATLDEHNNEDNLDPKLLLPKKTWQMPVFGGIFNLIEFIVSFGRAIELPSSRHILGFLKNLVLPFIALYSIYSTVDLKCKHTKVNALLTGAYALCHFGWIALFICGTINHGFVAFGWSAFFLNACILTSLRTDVRGKLGIGGNFVGDFVAGSFLYPQALLQMELQLAEDNNHEVEYVEEKDEIELADSLLNEHQA